MASAADPHEQLSCARAKRGEDLASLSARTGLRIHHIRAIEEGRFGDLPAGIYARAAIRSFATAYGLDPDAVLADCSALLPNIKDPIDALARSHGMSPTPERTAQTPERPVHMSERAAHATARTIAASERRLRPFAAASVDAAFTGGLLLAASAAAALLARVSITSLGSSAVSLFVVGVIFEAAYYGWMGGLSGMTLGEYAVGPAPLQRDPRPLTLPAIALRALAAATADARAIIQMGVWIRRRFTRGAARTAPPPEPSPSPPPPLCREEALTWSMNQRATVPPPPLRPRHG